MPLWAKSAFRTDLNLSAMPPTVVKFVTAKASKTRKDQQGSGHCLQAIPSKALKIAQFQQVSTMAMTWFGTRGSEVQILSPRPIYLN